MNFSHSDFDKNICLLNWGNVTTGLRIPAEAFANNIFYFLIYKFMKKFWQFKFFTLFCFIFLSTSCFAEWCGIYRDTNKTAFCVGHREECKDNRDYFCVKKIIVESLKPINFHLGFRQIVLPTFSTARIGGTHTK